MTEICEWIAGHVEAGESELETAYRETAEEAGLQKHHLQRIDGFEKVLQYEVRGQTKKVFYWLAQLCDPDTPVIISSEHHQFAWFPLDAAVQNAAFPDMQKLLYEANSFIQEHVNVRWQVTMIFCYIHMYNWLWLKVMHF